MLPGLKDRKYWVDSLTAIARPVLEHLARRELKAVMPLECAAGRESDRAHFSHLEAFARTMTGLALRKTRRRSSCAGGLPSWPGKASTLLPTRNRRII